jgi:hypothetical protein
VFLCVCVSVVGGGGGEGLCTGFRVYLCSCENDSRLPIENTKQNGRRKRWVGGRRGGRGGEIHAPARLVLGKSSAPPEGKHAESLGAKGLYSPRRGEDALSKLLCLLIQEPGEGLKGRTIL